MGVLPLPWLRSVAGSVGPIYFPRDRDSRDVYGRDICRRPLSHSCGGCCHRYGPFRRRRETQSSSLRWPQQRFQSQSRHRFRIRRTPLRRGYTNQPERVLDTGIFNIEVMCIAVHRRRGGENVCPRAFDRQAVDIRSLNRAQRGAFLAAQPTKIRLVNRR